MTAVFTQTPYDHRGPWRRAAARGNGNRISKHGAIRGTPGYPLQALRIPCLSIQRLANAGIDRAAQPDRSDALRIGEAHGDQPAFGFAAGASPGAAAAWYSALVGHGRISPTRRPRPGP